MSDLSTLIDQLSLKAHVKIRNKFSGFFNTLETTEWFLHIEHCTYRSFKIELEGENLNNLIENALKLLEDFEISVEKKREALETLNPDMDKYKIADILRREIVE